MSHATAPTWRFLKASELPEPEEVYYGRTWGKWTLNKNLTLTHQDRGSYELDLEKMATSAEVLDTIFQVSNKLWCSPKDAGDLLDALRDTINPQGTLCSCGRNKKFVPTPYLKKKIKPKPTIQ